MIEIGGFMKIFSLFEEKKVEEKKEKSFNKEKACTRKDLALIRGTIKGLSEESKRFRQKYINPSSGEKKHSLQSQRKWLGQQARAYMLAYAFLRGKKYSEVEPNRPLDTYYQKCILDHLKKDTWYTVIESLYSPTLWKVYAIIYRNSSHATHVIRRAEEYYDKHPLKIWVEEDYNPVFETKSVEEGHE
jgi:hypothetical protein